MRKIILVVICFVVYFSEAYTKDILTLACLPPEGTMDQDAKVSYVTSVENSFTKAGHRVADRQRLEKLMKEILFQQTSGMVDESQALAEAGKIMKVQYLAVVSVDKWDEEKVTGAANTRAAGNILNAVLGSSVKNEPSNSSDLIIVQNVRLSVKIIEVETSFIVASGVAQGKIGVDPVKLSDSIIKDIEKQLNTKKKK